MDGWIKHISVDDFKGTETYEQFSAKRMEELTKKVSLNFACSTPPSGHVHRCKVQAKTGGMKIVKKAGLPYQLQTIHLVQEWEKVREDVRYCSKNAAGTKPPKFKTLC